MKIKKVYIIVLNMLVFINIFPQNLTLRDAINLALERNEEILQYKSKLEGKEYENLAAWGNFLPSVSLEGAYTHLDDNLEFDLNSIKDAIIQLQASDQTDLANIYNILSTGVSLTDEEKLSVYNQTQSALDAAIPSLKLTLKEQDYNSAAFVGTQPLFLGGKLIAGKKYASAEEKSAFYDLKKTENETIAEVTKLYLQNLLLSEIVKTRMNVLEGIKLHKRNAEKLFEQGLIAKYHLLRAEVAVAEAERNLFKDENNLELVLISLKSTIGLDEESRVELADTLKFSQISGSLDDYMYHSKNNQPILKMIEQKKVAAEQNYNLARSEFLPKVAAFGKYELYPEYLSALEPRWAVGIQAKFNIFNGFKDYLKIQSSLALEDEIDHIRLDAEKKLSLWINKSYRDVNNYAEEYNKLQASLNLAKENFRQNSKRFNSGLGTSIEVIDARLTLEKIEIDIYKALYNYYSAITDLENASGNVKSILNVWNN